MKFTNLIEDVQNLGENMDAFSWINRSFVERASLFKVKILKHILPLKNS